MNLYEFGGRVPVRYLTNSKADVTVGGQLYESLAIRRSTYKLDQLKTKGNMIVIFPGDDRWALDLVRPNAYEITVQVKTITGRVFWIGELLEINVQTDRRIKMIFRPRQSVRETLGERRLFQHHCPYLVYGDRCQATENRITAPVIDFSYADTRRVKVNPVLPSRYTGKSFEGGILSPGSPYGDFWIINVDTTPSDGILLTTQESLPPGMPWTVYLLAGCDRTPDQCVSIHRNIKNFGGFWGLRRSPFDGGIAG